MTDELGENTGGVAVMDASKPKRRWSPPERTPEERARKAALSFDRNDTMNWFNGDTSLEHYEEDLGFNRRDLEGKIVLDLGTSPSDKLARDLQAAGIHATVVGISPDLRDDREKHPDLPEDWKRKAATGIAQAMPFRDDSIDVVLGEYSVTWKASTYPEQVQAWVSEIGRVLKPGGEGRVGPTYNDGRNKYSMGESYENLIKFAQGAGLEVEINDNHILFKKPEKLETSD